MRKVVALTTVMLAVIGLSGCSKVSPETLRGMHNGIGNYMSQEVNSIKDPLSVLDSEILSSMIASASNTIENERSKTIEINVDGELNALELGGYTEVVKLRAGDKDFNNLEDLTKSKLRLGKYSGGRIETEAKVFVSINLEEINNWCEELASKYYIKYEPPSVTFRNGVSDVDMGIEGRELDIDDLKSKIYNAIRDNTYEINVETRSIKANTSKEDLMSIRAKISSFSTGYSSSGASRKNNIKIAASNINDTLLLPGETLSVDKAIKSRNKANGYTKAGSYLNGKTVQTYGGGVCQVSTTLYGAVLRAGIIPLERNPHSMSVGYVPLGLDAAISEGYKDLKIQNNYDTPIYIEAHANGNTITFNVWGEPDLTGGHSYKPRSVTKSSLKADAYLDIYDASGKKIDSIQLRSSTYKPHN